MGRSNKKSKNAVGPEKFLTRQPSRDIFIAVDGPLKEFVERKAGEKNCRSVPAFVYDLVRQAFEAEQQTA